MRNISSSGCIFVGRNAKIGQTWKSDGEDWARNPYFTITIIIEPDVRGTVINFTHEDILESAVKNVKEGWNTYYWDPLKEMFP